MSKRAPLDLKREIGQRVAEEQRQFGHDRQLTVGSSEVFGCHRAAAFKRRWPELATEPEDKDDLEWGASERGNVIENSFAVPMLRGIFGDAAKYLGDDQVTLFDKEAPLSCTPDGLFLQQPRDFLSTYGVPDLGLDENDVALEIKTFDPRSGDLKKEARGRHIGQNIIQQGMFRRVTNYQPNWGLIAYFNPSDLKDIRPFPVKYDDNIYRRGQQRAADVFDLTKTAKDFKPEGKRTGQCQYCEFADACYRVEMESFPTKIIPLNEIDPQQQEELANLAQTCYAARKAKKDAEKAEKLASEALRFKMFDLETQRAKGDGWSVSIRTQSGRFTLNEQAMIDAGLDPEEYKKQGNDFFVMTVKGDD